MIKNKNLKTNINNKNPKMTMINKILYITDLHIKLKNLSEIGYLTDAIKTSKNVSLIIIGGDVINKRYINHFCYNEAEKLIRVCSKVAMTYVLVGNHDYVDKNQFLTDKHWMNHLKTWPNVIIVDTVTTIMCGFQITCVPYVPNGRLVEALDISGTHWKDSRLIFAHQEIKGCRVGKKISSVGDFWDSSYPTLISGHIHDEQTVKTNVIYPGSTMNQGHQNKRQKIWFINTSFTKNGVFNYSMIFSFFKTIDRETIIVKTFDDLCYINNSKIDLTDTILILEEYDCCKISKIKSSKIFLELAKRAHFICFAD